MSYRSIKFLNHPSKESQATISTGIIKNRKKTRTNYSIRIKDCHKEIWLHGNLDSKNSKNNALFKVRTLIKELQKMEKRIDKI